MDQDYPLTDPSPGATPSIYPFSIQLLPNIFQRAMDFFLLMLHHLNGRNPDSHWQDDLRSAHSLIGSSRWKVGEEIFLYIGNLFQYIANIFPHQPSINKYLH